MPHNGVVSIDVLGPRQLELMVAPELRFVGTAALGQVAPDLQREMGEMSDLPEPRQHVARALAHAAGCQRPVCLPGDGEACRNPAADLPFPHLAGRSRL